MKYPHMKRFSRIVLLLSSFLSAFAITANAQDDIEKLLKESLADGKILIGAYVSPMMKSVSLAANQGWYNTAKPHKIAGVDLTVTVNSMTIPTDQLFYDVSKLGLQQVEIATKPTSPDSPLAPTIFGPDRAPTFWLKADHSQTFQGPPGIDLKGNIKKNIMPVPMAHLGIGLPKSTDLKIRFTPSIDLGDQGKLKLFGIGVMHDIKQWIPGIKLLPFDLSGFVGYTNLKLTTVFANDPQSKPETGEFQMTSTTIQGLISKKFSVVTLYGGLGYNIAKSSLAMKGWYDINNDNTKQTTEVDPLDLKFAASGPRATLGMRLKLAVFTLHTDYTLQKYKCFTVGFGIAVR
jgi:hypothetical protein